MTQLAAAGLPEVAGYVEAVTADRVLGWAWCPRTPQVRAEIELRAGDAVVARMIADQPRADLASSGIGDGNHAFALAIPESCRDRAAELRVYASTPGGTPVAIGVPPAAEALSDQVGRMLRGMDALLGAQRVLHRNLAAAVASRSESGTEAAIGRLAELQATLVDQVATLERFVVRLDERMAAPPAAAARAAVPRAAIVALAVSGLALAVAIVGLARSIGA